ncbi:threonine/homoserine efflux transporter RhtA [Motilibacter rhizosphaerae]|uniref:Threonine/homoserine efflux transporter RhtA n=1 Tax=Motilibacter rhizosphaerae TaxID=598652 RepID=A0A4Q7NNJ3_9ACTN|nr:EamA family transporter [Motilibacter rhizosphaerae]RZS86795.1 threonine/homoserine efflux transporter RhtA [Motilibacter rhizosphaerae]
MPGSSSRGTGLWLALLSGASFGSSGSFATSLLDAGWTPAAAVSARLLVAFVVLTPFALRELRSGVAGLRRSAGAVVGYGVLAVAAAQLCYFGAVPRLGVGVALLLEYLGILLVVGWMWLRHGQRPRRLTGAGAALALVGLALVLDLGGGVRLDPVGVLWGLGAAVGLAVYFVRSAEQPEDLPPVVLAWGGLGVGALVLLAAGATGHPRLHASTRSVELLSHAVPPLVPVLGLAVVAAALAYATGIAGARLLGPRLASFIGLSEVLFAVAFAWLLLGQLPAPVQLVGGAVLLAGVVLVRVDELRDPQPALPEPAGAGAVAG